MQIRCPKHLHQMQIRCQKPPAPNANPLPKNTCKVGTHGPCVRRPADAILLIINLKTSPRGAASPGEPIRFRASSLDLSWPLSRDHSPQDPRRHCTPCRGSLFRDLSPQTRTHSPPSPICPIRPIGLKSQHPDQQPL
jgi:hypothetical protein